MILENPQGYTPRVESVLFRSREAAGKFKSRTVGTEHQCRASGFYQTLGYREIGEAYLDEFCPHILMGKSL